MKLSNLIPIREIEFKAVSKDSGKIVVFKNKDNYNKAMKAGTHVDVKSKQGKDLLKKGNQAQPKLSGTSIFGKKASTNTKADVKSIVKNILKTANPEFKGTHKLSDIQNDIEIDSSNADGKELKSRMNKKEKGIYVQTDETEGTVIFDDGSQYKFHHVEDGPIPVTKVK